MAEPDFTQETHLLMGEAKPLKQWVGRVAWTIISNSPDHFGSVYYEASYEADVTQEPQRVIEFASGIESGSEVQFEGLSKAMQRRLVRLINARHERDLNSVNEPLQAELRFQSDSDSSIIPGVDTTVLSLQVDFSELLEESDSGLQVDFSKLLTELDTSNAVLEEQQTVISALRQSTEIALSELAEAVAAL